MTGKLRSYPAAVSVAVLDFAAVVLVLSGSVAIGVAQLIADLTGLLGAVALTAKLPRPLGYLMGLSGLAYILQGWALGSEGFSATNTFAILVGYVLILAWIIWLAVVALRPAAARSAAR